MKRLSTRAVFLLAFASLLLGALIYLFTRRGLMLHAWTSAPSLPTFSRVPSWVRYCLPDGLWQFSFCLAVFHVWRDAPRSLERALMLALPLFLGLGTEVAQAFHLIEGVFDARDLFFEAGFGLLAALVVFLPSPRQSPAPAPPIRPSTLRSSRRGLFALFRAR